jgi:hypothetical protein
MSYEDEEGKVWAGSVKIDAVEYATYERWELKDGLYRILMDLRPVPRWRCPGGTSLPRPSLILSPPKHQHHNTHGLNNHRNRHLLDNHKR